jgi:hypothetical protein
MMSDFVWRYTKNGRVTHALAVRGPMSVDRIALCGVSPPLFKPFWFGANEGEREKAESMRRCHRCHHHLERTKLPWATS